jgi:GDP-L-fucose synthase
MKTEKKNNILVTGHRGLLGGEILKELRKQNYKNIFFITKKKLDLRDTKKVLDFFRRIKFDYVYLCAAKVGGIMANVKYPKDFICDNLEITLNITKACHETKVKKLLFIGSSCIYPEKTKQPMKEEYLLTSKMEKSNEAYAISKIAGIKICESYNRQHKTDFRCVMPTNLFGENDNFDPENSHVIPGIINKIYRANKEKKNFVKLWGTGKPIREFLFSNDMAKSCIKIMSLSRNKLNKFIKPQQSHINLGTGKGISIKELSLIVASVIGYKGQIIFDDNYPDGHPIKVNDISIQTKLGIKSKYDLKSGIEKCYRGYLKYYGKL